MGCSARRSEGSVAGHTTEEQQRTAPVSASRNGILAVSVSLSIAGASQIGIDYHLLFAGNLILR